MSKNPAGAIASSRLSHHVAKMKPRTDKELRELSDKIESEWFRKVREAEERYQKDKNLVAITSELGAQTKLAFIRFNILEKF